MIADVWRGELADGRPVVVKVTDYDAALEADGLEALAAAGAPVPTVHAVDSSVLVMSYVSGPPMWRELGATLAAVHGHEGEEFGWYQDNVIGPLPQDNTPRTSWGEFYVEQRIRPWLHIAALPESVRRRLSGACDGPLADLLEHGGNPSLVHGDLWSGNIVAGRAIIDPAVHRADREFELAFADLFGGIPHDFWRGYLEAWPLDAGWERRRPALQLYHLLVHVELFGQGYVGAVIQRLDRLGW